MKRSDIDWTILRGAIVICVVSVLLSSLLIGSSYYFRRQMQREFNANNAQFQNISRRYLAVDEEEKQIRDYLPKFVGLYNRGVIGQERRLDWIEVLRKTGDDLKLPALNYEIKSQSVYAPPFPAVTGRYKLYDSGMSLNASLAHEVDLLRVFEYLDRNAAGSYTATGCQLQRMTEAVDPTVVRPNISAKCDLIWFTIRLADGKDIKI